MEMQAERSRIQKIRIIREALWGFIAQSFVVAPNLPAALGQKRRESSCPKQVLIPRLRQGHQIYTGTRLDFRQFVTAGR